MSRGIVPIGLTIHPQETFEQSPLNGDDSAKTAHPCRALSPSDVYTRPSYYLQNWEDEEKYLEKREKPVQAITWDN